MAKIYAILIIKGAKNYADVPAQIRDQVRQVLVDLGREDLITE